MKFFLDHDLSPKFLDILLSNRDEATLLRDHFDTTKTVEDHVWIDFACNQGWIGVTADNNILGKPQNLAIIKAYEVPVIFLWGKLSSIRGADQMKWMKKNWKKISRSVRNSKRDGCFGYCYFKVGKDGRVTKITP